MATPPFALVVVRAKPKPSMVVPAVMLPIRSALNTWLLALVVVGLVEFVELLSVIVLPGALQVTVTGSVPEVAHDCARALCGLAIAAASMAPVSAVVASRVERRRSAAGRGHDLSATVRTSP